MNRICEHCRKAYYAPTDFSKYCSARCKSAFHRAKSGEPERKQKLLSQLGELKRVRPMAHEASPLTEKPEAPIVWEDHRIELDQEQP